MKNLKSTIIFLLAASSISLTSCEFTKDLANSFGSALDAYAQVKYQEEQRKAIYQNNQSFTSQQSTVTKAQSSYSSQTTRCSYNSKSDNQVAKARTPANNRSATRSGTARRPQPRTKVATSTRPVQRSRDIRATKKPQNARPAPKSNKGKGKPIRTAPYKW